MVANYLKLPLLSTWQPNYLKLPMHLTALCAPLGAGKDGVSSNPRRSSQIGQISQEFRRLKFDSRWRIETRWESVGLQVRKDLHAGTWSPTAFNSNRRGTLPHFGAIECRACLSRRFAAQSLALWQQPETIRLERFAMTEHIARITFDTIIDCQRIINKFIT